jgi:hypothetical protein
LKWTVSDEPAQRLTHVGPDDGAGVNEEFTLSGALRTRDRLPMLLYSTNRLSSALHDVRGRYQVDKRMSFGPRSVAAPRRRARGPTSPAD